MAGHWPCIQPAIAEKCSKLRREFGWHTPCCTAVMHNPDELQTHGARCVAAYLNIDATAPTLTTAERSILTLLLDGHTNAGIGAARGTSLHTVANQVASLLRKFGLCSRVELTARVARALCDEVQRERSSRALPVARSGLASLTTKQAQVVTLRAQGLSVKFIGYELGIAPSTVCTRLKMAKQRLEIRSSLELCALFGPGGRADVMSLDTASAAGFQ